MPEPLLTFGLVRLETFDWTAPDNSCQIHLDITSMLAEISAGRLSYRLIKAPLDPDFANDWLLQRIDDLSYMQGLTYARLQVPVLGVDLPDNTVLLVDGAHRYIARLIAHYTTVWHRIVRLPHWLPFATITGTLPGSEGG